MKAYRYWCIYENCFEEARKCKTRSEFATHKGAYDSARRNGWLDDYYWFENKYKSSGYWDNYEHCFEEAKKYETKSEFALGNGSAYNGARKNGWLDDYYWLVDKRVKLYTDKIDCVYYYYFEQTHSIYVGRTIDKKRRDKAHIYGIDDDAVAKYAYENGFQVPEMVIIEDNLTVEQGQKQEGFWENFYREHGYNVLNRCKCGSIGSIGNGKLTKESVFEIARQYKIKKEFQYKNSGAYHKARKMGWLKEMNWFENGHLLNRTSKTIQQYTETGQFIAEYPSLKEASQINGYTQSHISSCCNGKRLMAYGYIWKYVS